MNDGWSDEEIRASVEAYLDMLRKERNNQPFVKKQYYRELAARFGRTEKAFEYRMENISYVLSLKGRDWISSLKPARNVGTNVAEKIERQLDFVEGRKSTPTVVFDMTVKKITPEELRQKPAGNVRPQSTLTEVTQFSRDPAVKAWVLQEANGQCECCGQPAPFADPYGSPFLEVHHVKQLADGGADVVSNTVAVCPNCHRELHYGSEAKALGESMLKSINRLRKTS